MDILYVPCKAGWMSRVRKVEMKATNFADQRLLYCLCEGMKDGAEITIATEEREITFHYQAKENSNAKHTSQSTD